MFTKVQFLFIIFFTFCKAGKKYQKITFDDEDEFNSFIKKHFNGFGQSLLNDSDFNIPQQIQKQQRSKPLSIYDVANFLQLIYVSQRKLVTNPFLKRPDIIVPKKNQILKEKNKPQQQQVPGQLLKISKLTFDNINNYRASRGLSKWKWDDQVYNLCQQHTGYQMQRNTISHDHFNKRLQNYPTKNENVAYFTSSNISEQDAANKFFNQWKNSPGHHRNMIAKNVRYGAVGVSLKGKSYYATMIAVDKQQLIITLF